MFRTKPTNPTTPTKQAKIIQFRMIRRRAILIRRRAIENCSIEVSVHFAIKIDDAIKVKLAKCLVVDVEVNENVARLVFELQRPWTHVRDANATRQTRIDFDIDVRLERLGELITCS